MTAEALPTRIEDVAWRSLPMRHGDPLEVHPLRAEGDTSVLLARFSPGWARRAPVACTAAEEFVVLEGSLEVNGTVLAAGSVAHVPAGAERSTTTSAEGCTAIAWFVGSLRWEDAEHTAAPGRLLIWHPWDGPGGTDWGTPLAAWSLLVAQSKATGPALGDTVDLDAPAWAPLATGGRSAHPSDHRVLRRTARGG